MPHYRLAEYGLKVVKAKGKEHLSDLPYFRSNFVSFGSCRSFVLADSRPREGPTVALGKDRKEWRC